jgi:hypothetical protein
MPKLLESDFLTVDLSSVFKNRTNTEAGQQPAVSEPDTANAEVQSITDWGKELESRLGANSELSAGARESDYSIETKFFEEYFNANWEDSAVVKQLMLMGEPLKKAIKVLGFDVKTNPILAFISNDYVIEALIKTKLLNASTFKAIYNSIAQKLIAHSQFFTANDYNIIYYPDLYKRSAAEILEYIKLQNNILSSSASKYTKAILIVNKKVFLHLSEEKNFSKLLTEIKSKNINIALRLDDASTLKNIKINSITLAKQLKNALYGSDISKQHTSNLNTSSKNTIANALNTPAKKLAALQYISITTDNADAKEALSSDHFSQVSNRELMKATLDLADILPKNILAEKDANRLVELILGDI